MMKFNLYAAIVFSLAFVAVGSAQAPASSAQGSTEYTQPQIKKLARTAHTQEQYSTLAAYYGKQQKDFAQQAADEKQEWERRSQSNAGAAQKYPRPADSSKNRFEYFAYEADQMGQQAAHYENLSASASPAPVK